MNGHGGERDGAGRKRKAERYAPQIESFTDRCADHLAAGFERLCELINGGVRVEVKRQKAGTLTRKDVLRNKDGDPIADKNGKFVPIEVPLYPDLDKEEMVVVEEKTVTNPPDVRAIQELNERVLGKASQPVELGNGDDGPLKIQVVYADADPPSDAAEAPLGPGEDTPGDEAV